MAPNPGIVRSKLDGAVQIGQSTLILLEMSIGAPPLSIASGIEGIRFNGIIVIGQRVLIVL